ncbi:MULTISPECIES: YihY/virulence factor BrkB family protein [Marichromatium]|uniref:tRNA-processing RNAse BN n=1 Tax=Marichromatium gracile TaxID=1048 RepID=A0A4R4A4X9_MARGR|nr:MULTISPECIES: YihY/virulence factor BrkB family protein [Marichromatium]MBK1710023.1 ribonuclease BN [Marichromatium gracile]RNE92543.1 YihY/virulence factor BrkB family protein [Marichromatium sp. AB32]TCW33254.1 tRNA-processing RNAse BN [Marichromatium gracile]
MQAKTAFVTRLEQILWSERGTRPRWQRPLICLARLLHALARDLTEGNLRLHAMGLVYTTLLSLVPLLAVSFSVLKGFGVHNQLEPLLQNALAPLGESGQEINTRLIEFVDRMQVGVLGSVGLALLLYTVISLIQKIEQAFNYTWRVERPRPFAQRFTQYMSVLLVGPVLFFSALGLSASLGDNVYVRSLMAVAPLGVLLELARLLAPYLLISLTFAFFYMFVPNARVRIVSALVGALAAGLLWEAAGALFSTFIGGSTRYTAIYSSLAILILLMIWIYVAWLILLVGASIAFYHQHPHYLDGRTREPRLSNRLRERLPLQLAARIARAHHRGQTAPSQVELAAELGVAEGVLEQPLRLLESREVVLATATEPVGYVPAQDPGRITIAWLLARIRSFEEEEDGYRPRPPEAALGTLEARLEESREAVLGTLTLAALATADGDDRDDSEDGEDCNKTAA